jgi:hypothetical protein
MITAGICPIMTYRDLWLRGSVRANPLRLRGIETVDLKAETVDPLRYTQRWAEDSGRSRICLLFIRLVVGCRSQRAEESGQASRNRD